MHLLNLPLINTFSLADERVLLHPTPSPRATMVTNNDDGLVNTEELQLMDLATVRAATNEFSSSNKLGQGGFGCVYKVDKCSQIRFASQVLSEYKSDHFLGFEIFLGCSTRWERNSC